MVMSTELIRNGGFESGAFGPGWQQTPGAAVVDSDVTDATRHAGRYCLRLGSTAFVEQSFNPWICRAAGDLTFYVKAAAGSDCGPFSVRIVYTDGTVETCVVGGLSGEWTQRRLPLDHTRPLRKIVFNAADLQTLYIDDVSLLGSKRWGVKKF